MINTGYLLLIYIVYKFYYLYIISGKE